jgi:Tol biopolymer transport system component/ABC-type branched-subunit amino acid transport system substrate-binding protein
MRRKGLFRLIAGAAGCLGVAFGGVASAAPSGQVVIAKGQPVQLAVALDDSGLLAESGPSLRNAVQAAVERHPNVRGFPIQINALDATCGGGSGAALAQNATVANSVVANAQNVAVIGHACSLEAPAWLPVYETAGLVTINGSTTGTFVPALGPSVFNGTAVPEPGFAPWYAAVKALPADVRWSNFFQARFGSSPADFADLYYDATTVLVAALQMSARVDHDNLVIDRAALATALRQMRGFPGVTCSITFDPLTGSRVNDPAALARCASATSEIVFASDRANANPGEIFSLAAGRAPVDVSRSPATDLDAAIAPDGKRAAFWSNRTGGMRLYVSGLGGAGVRLVPQPHPGGSDQVMPLAFSPDGSRLLATTTTGTSCALFLVEVLSPRGLRVGNGCNAAWSSDGRSIAATAGRRVIVYDTTGRRRFSLAGSRALWSASGRLAVVNAAGTKTIVLDQRGRVLVHVPGAATGWSATGSRLLLSRPGAILVADSLGSRRPRVLVHGPKTWSPSAVAFTPDGALVRYLPPSGAGFLAIPVAGGTPRSLPGFGVWSRDGRYAFTRALPPAVVGGLPRVEVEIGDRLGRNARQAGVFTSDDHDASVLTWSANGGRLLYESSVRAPRDLWAVAADGSNLHQLTHAGPDASAPAWSADGMRLAYTLAPFTGGLCGFCLGSVVLAGPDGSVQSTIPGAIAGQASNDGSPSWAPSGNRLVVGVCCSGELDAVGSDGNARLRLVPGASGTFASLGVWSPDGASIAEVGSGGSIDLVAPDGTGTRVLLAGSGNDQATAIAWSHDSKLVAYSAPDGVHVVPADGSAPPRLIAAANSAGGLSFSPDDSQLVYAAQRVDPGGPPQSDLFVVSLQGGGPSRVLAPSPYDDTSPAWQPLPSS